MSEPTTESPQPVIVRHVISCPRRTSGTDYCWCAPDTPGNTHFADLPRSNVDPDNDVRHPPG